jgi:dihydroneopterin aldolase
MNDRIELRGLRLHGYHGVGADERRDGQPFVVDIALDTDTTRAAESDALTDTVDYAVVAERVAAIVTGEPVQLIETLAARIADDCLRDARVSSVQVTVHKPEAPVGLPVDDVVVTVTRTRG